MLSTCIRPHHTQRHPPAAGRPPFLQAKGLEDTREHRAPSLTRTLRPSYFHCSLRSQIFLSCLCHPSHWQVYSPARRGPQLLLPRGVQGWTAQALWAPPAHPVSATGDKCVYTPSKTHFTLLQKNERSLHKTHPISLRHFTHRRYRMFWKYLKSICCYVQKSSARFLPSSHKEHMRPFPSTGRGHSQFSSTQSRERALALRGSRRGWHMGVHHCSLRWPVPPPGYRPPGTGSRHGAPQGTQGTNFGTGATGSLWLAESAKWLTYSNCFRCTLYKVLYKTLFKTTCPNKSQGWCN